MESISPLISILIKVNRLSQLCQICNKYQNFFMQTTITDKNYGKNCYLDNVSLPFPVLTMLRDNDCNLRQAMLLVCKIV